MVAIDAVGCRGERERERDMRVDREKRGGKHSLYFSTYSKTRGKLMLDMLPSSMAVLPARRFMIKY